MNDFNKIMMPMIRNVLPKLIASELAGIQPMGINYKFILYNKYPEIETDMITVHISIRPFMGPDHIEPNDYYRPWLEENIGKQGVSWNWHIIDMPRGLLAIEFSDTQYASLFELRWP